MIFCEYMETHLGELELTADETGLLGVLFTKTKSGEMPGRDVIRNQFTEEARKQLELYFENKLDHFDLQLSFHGTDFQQKVWKELCAIPFGRTISYLTLARQLGDEKCIRAAASANGRNPFAIVVPCHRVIGSNGKLVGYAGDLWRKQWLLGHELDKTSKQTSLF